MIYQRVPWEDGNQGHIISALDVAIKSLSHCSGRITGDLRPGLPAQLEKRLIFKAHFTEHAHLLCVILFFQTGKKVLIKVVHTKVSVTN